MVNFFIENFQYLIEVLGFVFAFFIGTKARKIKLKDQEFSAYQKKLENFEKEFKIKTEMLDILKKDFDDRNDYLSDRNIQLEQNRSKMDKIILDQQVFIEKQRQVIDKQAVKILEYEALLKVK